MRVTGAVGVVTGGASGIGEGVVRMLTENGGRAAVLDLPVSRGAELCAELGDSAEFFPLDITDPAQVAGTVDKVAQRFGRIDVLVNSAGISPAARVVARDGTLYPLERFRQGVEVNLLGAFDVLRNVTGVMARNEPGEDGERGLVVNIGSIAAFEGQVGQASYAASKGGIVAMTLPLARDLASHGVRVMCVCPGTIDTPMVRAASEEIRDYLRDANVFPKRLGRAGDIANVVRTCMETTYLNGDVIRVDAAVRMAPR
ncbi:3-hydroxy-2-methylbutyryl-CoA dehydrogenase [Prauserella marina]|uniref:3-hydroxyacyl-CoA dehydrogenase / 3-hydroxy-2-methylbutyryl-CoA dehydrogenase n=1 Tax=Prauserella marina TaxID=530584 RepID=A0A222VV25_9PSEU|nr:SDR family NAD(P)-dependent oxidoreductase [Prauserella marina]ASR37672.1 3-hydroxy-2-methylbutyryl-CoA dehydrogenase [Prauserella marina]PWV75599.1 3-hydroxyacyl-CoA dehydrogenase/3-hydroxy-2-methylbutyryl-CoA dehydrogenase [Prauserella marina]SDD30906.1 3-hydroxyacyl-CoA dehydrogenase / 3-hydroxy-2-methylbutyryl-CoA dehydrogenase [Prauserella marina]